MFITRSSASLANYIGMNKEGRVALEVISRDIRMAMDVNSASTTTLDIDVYGQGGITNNVYYTYDTDNKTIYRELDGTKEALMGNVESFSFNYFNLRRESTTSPISIKEVQMEAYMLRKTLALDNSNYIISARFMMRNRPVSN